MSEVADRNQRELVAPATFLTVDQYRRIDYVEHRLCSVWWVPHFSLSGMDLANQEMSVGSARHDATHLERVLNFYAVYTCPTRRLACQFLTVEFFFSSFLLQVDNRSKSADSKCFERSDKWWPQRTTRIGSVCLLPPESVCLQTSESLFTLILNCCFV